MSRWLHIPGFRNTKIVEVIAGRTVFMLRWKSEIKWRYRCNFGFHNRNVKKVLLVPTTFKVRTLIIERERENHFSRVRRKMFFYLKTVSDENQRGIPLKIRSSNYRRSNNEFLSTTRTSVYLHDDVINKYVNGLNKVSDATNYAKTDGGGDDEFHELYGHTRKELLRANDRPVTPNHFCRAWCAVSTVWPSFWRTDARIPVILLLSPFLVRITRNVVHRPKAYRTRLNSDNRCRYQTRRNRWRVDLRLEDYRASVSQII